MSPSPEVTATLSVLPDTKIGPKELPRRIQITDGTLSLVAKGFGQLDKVELPAGVYRATVESVKAPFEQMVFLAPGKNVSISYPVQAGDVLDSAAPVPGSDAMHETMRGPLDQAIARPAVHRNSRLVVMATHAARGRPSIDFSELRILDSTGNEFAKLADQSTTGPGNESRLFTHDIDEGGVVLEGPSGTFSADTPVRQLIWCDRDWCTLVFVSAHAETGKPDLNTASIYHWRIGSSFAPETRGAANDPYSFSVMASQRATELALHSLVSGRNLLSMKTIDTDLLVQKFANPMLGILGCHLLMQQPEKDEELIRIVLRKLDTLVPRHPDVIALRIMAKRAGIKTFRDDHIPALTWPPMLRKGFLAVRDQDWQKPGAIVAGSLLDRVRAHVVSGSVWTRWLADKALTRDSTIEQARSYVQQVARAGGKLVGADDLKWLGISRAQATAVAGVISKLMQAHPLGRLTLKAFHALFPVDAAKRSGRRKVVSSMTKPSLLTRRKSSRSVGKPRRPAAVGGAQFARAASAGPRARPVVVRAKAKKARVAMKKRVAPMRSRARRAKRKKRRR